MKTLITALLFTSFNALALDCNTESDYKKMTQCIANEATKIDKELNSTYQTILKKINNKDTLEAYPKALDAIKQNQRDWLKYAQNYCNLKQISASDADKSAQGSYYTTAYSDCFSSLSIRRIEELKSMDCEEGDMSSTCIINH